MIHECSCTGLEGNKAGAAYQDAAYGPRMRVHTPMKPRSPGEKRGRCTICGHEVVKSSAKKEVDGEDADGKKKKKRG